MSKRTLAWYTITHDDGSKYDVQAASLEDAERQGYENAPHAYVYAMKRPLSRGGARV